VKIGSFVINGGDKVIIGFATHIPSQTEQSYRSQRTDRDKKLPIKARSSLIDLIEKEATLIKSGHFPKPGFAKCKKRFRTII
tara:strand:- start:572 stop:817 length:246 start_codon:yes stop_codon:yes gene_type:complete